MHKKTHPELKLDFNLAKPKTFEEILPCKAVRQWALSHVIEVKMFSSFMEGIVGILIKI